MRFGLQCLVVVSVLVAGCTSSGAVTRPTEMPEYQALFSSYQAVSANLNASQGVVASLQSQVSTLNARPTEAAFASVQSQLNDAQQKLAQEQAKPDAATERAWLRVQLGAANASAKSLTMDRDAWKARALSAEANASGASQKTQALEARAQRAEQAVRLLWVDRNETATNLQRTADEVNLLASRGIAAAFSVATVANAGDPDLSLDLPNPCIAGTRCGGMDLDWNGTLLHGARPTMFSTKAVFYDTNLLFSVPIGCTASMQPFIGCKDAVLLSKPLTTNLGVGDVAVYSLTAQNTCDQSWTGSIIHRIIDVRSVNGEPQYEFQGDNRVTNPNPDPCWVPFSLVDGKMVAVLKDTVLS